MDPLTVKSLTNPRAPSDPTNGQDDGTSEVHSIPLPSPIPDTKSSNVFDMSNGALSALSSLATMLAGSSGSTHVSPAVRSSSPTEGIPLTPTAPPKDPPMVLGPPTDPHMGDPLLRTPRPPNGGYRQGDPISGPDLPPLFLGPPLGPPPATAPAGSPAAPSPIDIPIPTPAPGRTPPVTINPQDPDFVKLDKQKYLDTYNMLQNAPEGTGTWNGKTTTVTKDPSTGNITMKVDSNDGNFTTYKLDGSTGGISIDEHTTHEENLGDGSWDNTTSYTPGADGSFHEWSQLSGGGILGVLSDGGGGYIESPDGTVKHMHEG